MQNVENIKFLKKITDEDVGETTEFMTKDYELRKSSRGIVINDEGKIAILNKRSKNEFKLIGGGLDEDNDYEVAFLREALEETGCKVEITDFLGYVEETKSHNNFKQISACYVAKVIEDTNKTNFTDKEIEEGAQVLWMDVKEAYEKIKNCYENLKGSSYDDLYTTKFIPKRDIEILKIYMEKNNIIYRE